MSPVYFTEDVGTKDQVYNAIVQGAIMHGFIEILDNVVPCAIFITPSLCSAFAGAFCSSTLLPIQLSASRF